MREDFNGLISIGGRKIGKGQRPFMIAEVGINHGGDFEVAKQIAVCASTAGADAVKFQCHIPDEEMLETNVTPINSKESLYNLITRCSFTEEQEAKIKRLCESLGVIYLSTPFSKAAVDRLERLGVCAYKIGSGETNNPDFVEYVASKGKPVIMSTGMSSMYHLESSVDVLRRNNVNYALLHCVSAYPTPPECVGLHKMAFLADDFPDTVIGYSDHTEGIVACFAALSLGAQIVEKHVMLSDTSPYWQPSMMDEPDYYVSADTEEFAYIVHAANEIFTMLSEYDDSQTYQLESQTSLFAFGSVIATETIPSGGVMSVENTVVKRPGTGGMLAKDYKKLLGCYAIKEIPAGAQIKRGDLR